MIIKYSTYKPVGTPTPEAAIVGIPISTIQTFFGLTIIILVLALLAFVILKYGLPKLAHYLGFLTKQFREGVKGKK